MATSNWQILGLQKGCRYEMISSFFFRNSGVEITIAIISTLPMVLSNRSKSMGGGLCRIPHSFPFAIFF